MAARVAIIGTGYVGLVTGVCLSVQGHHIVCQDTDLERVHRLEGSVAPFHEPGLQERLAQARDGGTLTFTASLPDAVTDARFAFIAVGTPSLPDGDADLAAVDTVVRDLARHAPPGLVIVIRSTVPPGTADRLRRILDESGRRDLQLVNAPEFLAEGTAVRDFFAPERLVFGGPPGACQEVAALWEGIAPGAPRIICEHATAELAKYASNAFLAARVSLINEVANLCDSVGADVRTVAQVLGSDSRIGPKFLRPGIGYGGSCFPKDVRAIARFAQSKRVEAPMLNAIDRTNEGQWRRVHSLVQANLGAAPHRRVGIWGIAFKPGTDDVREAPALRLAGALLDSGIEVRMHDPAALVPPGLRERGLQQVSTPLEACHGAAVLVLATEWPIYAEVAPDAMAQAMAGRTVIDARNALHWDRFRGTGLTVIGIGARGAA